jgi:hypothetical protein
MLKLIDANKAAVYGLPAQDIADEKQYSEITIQNAIEAGAFKRTADAPKKTIAPVKGATED